MLGADAQAHRRNMHFQHNHSPIPQPTTGIVDEVTRTKLKQAEAEHHESSPQEHD